MVGERDETVHGTLLLDEVVDEGVDGAVGEGVELEGEGVLSEGQRRGIVVEHVAIGCEPSAVPMRGHRESG